MPRRRYWSEHGIVSVGVGRGDTSSRIAEANSDFIQNPPILFS